MNTQALVKRHVWGMRALIAASALAMLGITSPSAQAATTSQTYSFSSMLTNFSDVPLTVNKFDSSLGTLTSVSLQLTANFTTNITVTNIGADNSTGRVFTRVGVGVRDPGGYLANPAIDGNGMPTPGSLTASGTAPPNPNDPNNNSNTFSLAPNESVDFPPLSGSATATKTFTYASNPGAVLEFNGPGQIMMLVDARAITFFNATGGNIRAEQTTYAGASLKVTYVYTAGGPPLPEPASLPLVAGAGATAMGMTRLRRRRRA